MAAVYLAGRHAGRLRLGGPVIKTAHLSSISQVDPSVLLARPTWSVRSLLPPLPLAAPAANAAARITSTQLHQLLHISALPLPSTAQEEEKMIDTLQSQLQFLLDVQSVDTDGVAPLTSIRDETAEGFQETTVGLDQVRAALDAEEILGHMKRPRRRRAPVDNSGVEGWDVFGSTTSRSGNYFVVKT